MYKPCSPHATHIPARNISSVPNSRRAKCKDQKGQSVALTAPVRLASQHRPGTVPQMSKKISNKASSRAAQGTQLIALPQITTSNLPPMPTPRAPWPHTPLTEYR